MKSSFESQTGDGEKSYLKKEKIIVRRQPVNFSPAFSRPLIRRRICDELDLGNSANIFLCRERKILVSKDFGMHIGGGRRCAAHAFGLRIRRSRYQKLALGHQRRLENLFDNGALRSGFRRNYRMDCDGFRALVLQRGNADHAVFADRLVAIFAVDHFTARRVADGICVWNEHDARENNRAVTKCI